MFVRAGLKHRLDSCSPSLLDRAGEARVELKKSVFRKQLTVLGHCKRHEKCNCAYRFMFLAKQDLHLLGLVQEGDRFFIVECSNKEMKHDGKHIVEVIRGRFGVEGLEQLIVGLSFREVSSS